MHPTLAALAQTIDRLDSREALGRALDRLEDEYDAMDEMEQEVAERLMRDIRRRMDALPPAA